MGILNMSGIVKIFTSLLTSPIVGFIIGFGFMKLTLRLFGHMSPRAIGKHFAKLQIMSSTFMAFGHGSNDAQKAMGIITMALMASGRIHSLAGR
jgi:PiT family inorganic phosphate transporter